MEEKIFGDRNDKGNYIPKKRVSYPPIFVWPLAPIRALKWIFSFFTLEPFLCRNWFNILVCFISTA